MPYGLLLGNDDHWRKAARRFEMHRGARSRRARAAEPCASRTAHACRALTATLLQAHQRRVSEFADGSGARQKPRAFRRRRNVRSSNSEQHVLENRQSCPLNPRNRCRAVASQSRIRPWEGLRGPAAGGVRESCGTIRAPPRGCSVHAGPGPGRGRPKTCASPDSSQIKYGGLPLLPPASCYPC